MSQGGFSTVLYFYFGSGLLRERTSPKLGNIYNDDAGVIDVNCHGYLSLFIDSFLALTLMKLKVYIFYNTILRVEF